MPNCIRFNDGHFVQQFPNKKCHPRMLSCESFFQREYIWKLFVAETQQNCSHDARLFATSRWGPNGKAIYEFARVICEFKQLKDIYPHEKIHELAFSAAVNCFSISSKSFGEFAKVVIWRSYFKLATLSILRTPALPRSHVRCSQNAQHRHFQSIQVLQHFENPSYSTGLHLLNSATASFL